MDFRLLGPVEVNHRGRVVALGGHQQKALLAILVLHANQVVSTDRLIDFLWGETPPDTARKSLQACVSRLKSALDGDPSRIVAIPPGYMLRAEPEEVDALRFESLARRGKSLMADDPGKAAAVFRQALELWRGDSLADVADIEGIAPEAIRLEELRAQALEDRLESELAAGWGEDLVGELESLVAAYPLRERLRGLLMLALYRTGRQAEALRVFRDARRLLAEEIGIEPSAELVSLEERILLQDADLLAVPGEGPRRDGDTGPIRNPYKGLQPFGEADSGDFFGRATLVADIVRRLSAGERFLSLVGPSGCGKTSLVKAGLLPALRAGGGAGSDEWRIIEMTPGSDPFVELEAALRRAGCDSAPVGSVPTDELSISRAVLGALPAADGSALLVIDQLEELFFPGVAEIRRWDFVRALVDAATDTDRKVRVVVALRSDFYERALAFPEFAELVTAGLIAVSPLRGAEVEEAVVEPAGGAGVSVEPELLAQIVTDVAGQPGAMPLFQYALTEVFEHRQGTVLTLDAYRAVGGMCGALTRRADDLYSTFGHDAQAATRQLFLRLVTPGEGTLDIRRRVPIAELTGLGIDTELMQRVIDQFGRYRLITFDGSSGTATVEVAHEALLREWGRLREWIDASRNELRMHRTMAARAVEWLRSGRHPDYLPTGLRLEQAVEWSESTPLDLTTDEEDFLAAAVRRRDEERAAEERRALHEAAIERRSLRRLWAAIGVLAAAAIIAVILGSVALNQREAARRQAADAIEQATRAESATGQALRARNRQLAEELTLVSAAYTEVDPQVSLHLILHALNVLDTLELEVPMSTIAGLHWALQASGFQYPVVDAPTAVLVGPQGRTGVFDMGLDELIAHVREAITRPLRPEECALFFPQGNCPSLPDEYTKLTPALLPTAANPVPPLAGTQVSVWGVWTGLEAGKFKSSLDGILRETGISISYSGMSDLGPSIDAALAANDAPDLVLTPHPAAMAEWIDAGALVDLGAFIDVAGLEARMNPHLISLGTRNRSWPSQGNELYGVVIGLDIEGLIWYPQPEFEDAGYTIPSSWEELTALSEQMVADGRTPWCMGEASGVASGWPGTDWIESLVLHSAGPDGYDQWLSHEVPFNHPLIRQAFERYGQIVFSPEYVTGGPATVAGTHFAAAMNPMTHDPPGCWLHHQRLSISRFLPSDAEVGTDVWAFPFPSSTGQSAHQMLGGGEMVVAFHDRPEVRMVLDQILTSDFLPRYVGTASGRMLPYEDQDPSVYPDELRRWLSGMLQAALAADVFRFDGSELMPPAVGRCALWQAILEYLDEGPQGLDGVLADLDRAWAANQCGDQRALR